MGSSRLSNALRALAGGMQSIAAYRGENERIEGARQFEREMQASSQAFAQRLQELQMQHGENMLARQQEHGERMMGMQQEFARGEREASQLFDLKKFGMEQAGVNARHAQSMAAQWASIKQSAANLADQIKDRDLSRQLKVYELGVTQAAGQYQSVVEQMQKESVELMKNPMISIDPKKLTAARQELQQRYQPMLDEAQKKVQENIDSYASAVGIEKPGFDVSSNVDSTAQKVAGATASTPNVDRGKVAQAVEAARSQLGGAIPNEANLISGFMKAGLTRAEAVNAARQLRSSP